MQLPILQRGLREIRSGRVLINRLRLPLWAAAVLSSVLFALRHLPDHGWGAVGLTFIGGLIDCASYLSCGQVLPLPGIPAYYE